MKPRHAAALALVGCYLMLPASEASSASTPSAPPSDQITLDGCWTDGDGFYYFFGSDSNSYDLDGNTSKLDGLGSYVRISGTLVFGTLVVATAKELPTPIATPIPPVSSPSKWQKHTESSYGVTYSLPSTFPRSKYDNSEDAPRFVGHPNTEKLAKFEIPAEAWPQSNFGGGDFAIYVAPEIGDAATCNKFGDPDLQSKPYLGVKPTFESVYGFRYAHLVQGYAVPNEDLHYYHTFQNGQCYEIFLDFLFARIGVVDNGCTIPIMYPHSLIKAILAGISFFKARRSNESSQVERERPKTR